MRRRISGVLSICVVLLAAAIGADLVAAPVQEVNGSVTVLHGGIGADDRALIERQADEFNLKLTFARKGSGAYLADVKVVLRNKQGKVVIDTVASGPLLVARLPEGEYSVSATERDVTLTQSLVIKGKARRDWVFRFDLPQGAEPEFDAGK